MHIFLLCISGNKGGLDQLNQVQSSAIVALTMGWDYNMSKYVFSEMIENLNGKKEMFLLYPRFLQMILDARYPNLERTVEVLDSKFVGEGVYGLIKQSRSNAKMSYQGLYPLEKFGIFAELAELVPEPAVQVNAIVPEEHDVVAAPAVHIDLSDDEDNVEPPQVDIPVTVPLPTVEELAAIMLTIQKRSGIPPSESSSGTSMQVDDVNPDTDLITRKRRRRDPRPGVVESVSEPSVEPAAADTVITEAQQESQTEQETVDVTTTTAVLSQDVSQSEGPSTATKETTRVMFDMEQFNKVQSDYLRTGKNVLPDNELVDVHTLQKRIFELEQDSITKDMRLHFLERSDEEKTAKIKSLEDNLGQLSALFFDVKDKLWNRFGKDFETDSTAAKKKTATSSRTVQVESETTELPHIPDVTDAERRVDESEANIDRYLAGDTSIHPMTAEQRKEYLVMRNVNLNRDETNYNQEKFIMEIGKSRYDKEGNRSGIHSWSFDSDKDLWVVRRNDGSNEYYKNRVDFSSFTKVDLQELVNAPFTNPRDVSKARDFFNFLQRQALIGFTGMKTAESTLKKYRGVTDPVTKKTISTVKWPATKKLKTVPLLERYPDDP